MVFSILSAKWRLKLPKSQNRNNCNRTRGFSIDIETPLYYPAPPHVMKVMKHTILEHSLFNDAAAQHLHPLSLVHDLQLPGGVGEREEDIVSDPPCLYV